MCRKNCSQGSAGTLPGVPEIPAVPGTGGGAGAGGTARETEAGMFNRTLFLCGLTGLVTGCVLSQGEDVRSTESAEVIATPRTPPGGPLPNCLVPDGNEDATLSVSAATPCVRDSAFTHRVFYHLGRRAEGSQPFEVPFYGSAACTLSNVWNGAGGGRGTVPNVELSVTGGTARWGTGAAHVTVPAGTGGIGGPLIAEMLCSRLPTYRGQDWVPPECSNTERGACIRSSTNEPRILLYKTSPPTRGAEVTCAEVPSSLVAFQAPGGQKVPCTLEPRAAVMGPIAFSQSGPDSWLLCARGAPQDWQAYFPVPMRCGGSLR